LANLQFVPTRTRVGAYSEVPPVPAFHDSSPGTTMAHAHFADKIGYTQKSF